MDAEFVTVQPQIGAFRRMVRGSEFDISEMAITTYLCAKAHGKNRVERYEPEKAKFRTFLRVCLDRFVQNLRKTGDQVQYGGPMLCDGWRFPRNR